MKCRQLQQGFELGSLIPFPMMIAIMLSMPHNKYQATDFF